MYYDDQVCLDVMSMNIGSILLGGPWLSDNDMTIQGKTDIYYFIFKGKKILLHPFMKKPKIPSPLFILLKIFFNPLFLFHLSPHIRKKISESLPLDPLVSSLIEYFKDIFLEELPNSLPPLRKIQHNIDLVLGSSLPKLPHYRMIPTEHQELKRQVMDLIEKGFIKESLSPCAVPTLLVPKKDGTWHMYIYRRAIN
ncbi:unnamed protein product [Spirodela intermedia]|uniref:Uncharacterized protein n=1 Tax=Spirodela intermedia TaxID=51605 RepID=A0ABN7ED87_SPIIN|nr:unnamed protein product [Spirodela intermedia]